MAGSLNKVQLIGNLGADPEIRSTNSGGKVATFSLATSDTWKDKATGEKKERTEWHRVVVWNEGLVGIVDKYLAKGDRAYVEGQLQTRKYEKDGIERWTTEVVLSGFGGTILLMGGGRGGMSDPNDNASRPGNDGQSRMSQIMNDDIPF